MAEYHYKFANQIKEDEKNGFLKTSKSSYADEISKGDAVMFRLFSHTNKDNFRIDEQIDKFTGL